MKGSSLSPNGIRAIFFDLDGTLRRNEPPPEKVIFDLAVKLGVPDSFENRRGALRWVHYYWAQSAEMLQDEQKYKETEGEFWRNYIHKNLVAFKTPPALLEQILPHIHDYMLEHYKPQNQVVPGALETLQRLKSADFGLALLSNRTKPYKDLLEDLELEGYFELVVAAGEVQAWKPEPGIFYHALRKMRLEPHEAIYVGDNYYADVVGAQRAGLQPVLLDPEGIFPDAGCTVLTSMLELLDLLEEHDPQSGRYTRSKH